MGPDVPDPEPDIEDPPAPPAAELVAADVTAIAIPPSRTGVTTLDAADKTAGSMITKTEALPAVSFRVH